MAAHIPDFDLRLAETEADLRAGQRLRYEVFIEELGGTGALVDHDARLERDRFDAFCDHLLLFDRARPDAPAVAAYRLMRDDMMRRVGRFYSEDEYDLSVLKSSGRRLLELGRSCVHPEYRGGAALFHLWRGLLAYVERHRLEVMFGVASFHGTDVGAHAAPLSLLHHRHLAPPELRIRARPEHFQAMDLRPEAGIDRVAAMRAVPGLLKAYLRLGGFVGEGAFIDVPFNTVDVGVVVDITRIPKRVLAVYAAETGA